MPYDNPEQLSRAQAARRRGGAKTDKKRKDSTGANGGMLIEIGKGLLGIDSNKNKGKKDYGPAKNTNGAWAMGTPQGGVKPRPANPDKGKGKKDWGPPKDTSRAWAMGNTPNPRGGVTPGVKAAADRRTQPDAAYKGKGTRAGWTEANLDAERAKRMRAGHFAGTYYGPDAFKGDIRMLKSWRGSGSKESPTAFAAKYKKSNTSKKGWGGTYGKNVD